MFLTMGRVYQSWVNMERSRILGVPSISILSRDPNLSRKPPLKPRETDPVFGKNGG